MRARLEKRKGVPAGGWLRSAADLLSFSARPLQAHTVVGGRWCCLTPPPRSKPGRQAKKSPFRMFERQDLNIGTPVFETTILMGFIELFNSCCS